MAKRPPTVEFHPVYQDLFRPFRYKIYWGGRGGGKSWAIARALVLLGANKKLRILCAREIQHSIADSVHKLLSEQIYELNLESRYHVTKNAILGKNGTEFIFKGLRFNVREVKSTEGIDICWVEEAQSVSEESWSVLIPTVRKANSEIWLSFNPLDEDDPTYQRFILHTPPNAAVHKVGFRENPWFPDVLRQEMEYLKRVDYEAYLHVWEGEVRRISDAIIFKDKFVVEPFETPDSVRFYHGADWGFAQDPTALVRCFIKDRRLYVDMEAYGVGVELDETGALFDAIPTARKWPIKADSARPETISYMKRAGFNITAARKWQGSVEDGIAFMKSFEKIVLHPRCKHAIDEFGHYSYKVDKQTNDVLPIIVDANNHCIARGTLVSTERGNVPIEQVCAGDKVYTRDGLRLVTASIKTGDNRAVVEVQTATRRVICTPDHKIFVVGRGFVEAGELKAGDELVCLHSAAAFAQEPVLRVTPLPYGAEVYDLTVNGEHEFFANGILVHNCIDALRYALDGEIKGRGPAKQGGLNMYSNSIYL